MLHKCAFSALLAWDHFVGERKRLRALALHVLNRLSRGKIVLALDRWRAVLREEKRNELQHDRVQKLMRRVALRLKNAGFVKVWGAWEEFVWQRRTLRALTHEIYRRQGRGGAIYLAGRAALRDHSREVRKAAAVRLCLQSINDVDSL